MRIYTLECEFLIISNTTALNHDTFNDESLNFELKI